VDTLSRRRNIILGIIFLTGIIFVASLFRLQVLTPSYKKFATDNVVRKITQYPARGLIYDRNGTLLVHNKAAYDLVVTPRETGVFDTLSLCRMVNITKEEFLQKFREAKAYSSYKPSVIVKQIPPEKYAFLQEQLYKYNGFYIQTRTLREYTNNTAAHALGYVGEVTADDIAADTYYKSGDYTGINGIEKSYEPVLRGVKGEKYYMVDVHNRLMGSYADGKMDIPAQVGKNITSTIDMELQEYAEKLMQNKIGSIVAIEPSTGEVLLLVSAPSYDPNLLVGRERGANFSGLIADSLNPIFNRALMAQYPPGSTFKMANALIALQEGVITPFTQFTCSMGYHVGNFTLRCHHEQAFTLVGSIAQSCNTYYCYVFRYILEKPEFGGVRNGYDKWREYIESFGFGNRLGTDFVNELKGLVPTSDYYEQNVFKGSRWRALPIISLSIGQGELSVTPLQIANYAALLGNRGYYYIPHIVKNIEGETSIDPRFSEKRYSKVDAFYFEDVVAGMFSACENGTAAMSKIPGIEMCGKTGTAQNPHGAAHSVFMAFAPKVNPKIALSVYVENGMEGAKYAAPIASLIIEKYLNDSICSSRKWLESSMLNTNLINQYQTQ